MICKLCRASSDLKESHIIPEAFYESIYDQKHRALFIPSEDKSDLEFIQKGIREKLLCGECEKKLSKWESVLKKDLLDIGNKQSKFLKIANVVEDKLFKVEGIRYKEFKLGILSILWRLSIASDSLFSSYKLDIYEEKLRQILIDEDDLDERKYPIMISRYELDETFYPGVMMCFPPGKYDKIFTVQSFMIWGHRFMIFVNDNKFPQVEPKIFLKNSGEVYIDVRSLTELVSPQSVLSRIYDEEVNKMYERMV